MTERLSLKGEEVAPIVRLRHPWRLLGFGMVVASLLVAAFVAGQLVSSPQDKALAHANARVEVLASVEERVVNDGFSLPAAVVPAATVDLIVTESSAGSAPIASLGTDASTQTSAPQQPRTERIVLSRITMAVGAVLEVGDLAGEVSGRPVFVLPPVVPLYRDLVLGQKGPDVRAIQQVLLDLDYRGVALNGTFDRGTMDALRRLYKNYGFELPFVGDGAQGMAWREFVNLPTPNAVVDWVAEVGTVLGPESPLLRLRTSEATLVVQATTLEVDGLDTGQEVGVVIDGESPVSSTVRAIGEFATDEDSGASGYPVTVSIPEGVAVDGASVVSIQPWEQSAPSLAVPAVAIRQEGRDTYILALSDNPFDGADERAERFESVKVTIVAQAGGWVALADSDLLSVGRQILVSE